MPKAMLEDPHQKPIRSNLLYRFDNLVKKFIPNFNVRAILYFSFIFAVAMYLQIWRISSYAPQPPGTNETVIADENYWQSQRYKAKLQKQTVESFANELGNWLNHQDQEFAKRKFSDMIFINNGLTPADLAMVVPQSFNYLENQGQMRYQYAKEKGFLNDQATLVKLGSLICDSSEKTEKVTNIELYDWRYASMPKLAEFMKTKPDWKIQVKNQIVDVSDPRIENMELLKLRNVQTQASGLFSFLIFHDPQSNRISLADSAILENNGVDSSLTLSKIKILDKQPKIYFKSGFEGCRKINDAAQINYGQLD
ncbi:MAG TPA: hypothetical protein VF974_03430 [Patescibacteria group bacterium]